MGSEIRLIFSLLITIAFTALFSISTDVNGVENSTWTLGKEMLTNRTEITAAVLNDKVYVIAGADYRADGAVDTVEIYDPNTDEWTNGAPLPYVLDHAPSVVYDGKIYVVGGFLENKITTDKVLIYDPSTNEWSEGTPLPEPRAAHVSEVVNGTIYAISGLDLDHNPTSTNFAYNIENDTWVTKNPMPFPNGPKHHAASAEVDGQIYVLGGRLFGNGVPNEINDALTNLDDNMRYYPKTDKWTSMDPMPIRRSGFTAEALDGKIYVFGGQMADGANKNIERYDPVTNQWTLEPDMKVDRSGLAVAAYEDKLYVFGGQHKGLQALNVNEILSPVNNTGDQINSK
jgi:N-acetylneuraminic acid mutarotase